MSLTLIVVHYRTRDPLRRLLASIRECAPAALDSILIVNNSGEPLDDLIREADRPVRLLAPGRNLGYARGVNAGIRAVAEGDLLILNPDIQIRTGSVENLIRAAERHPRAGVVAPKLVNRDGTLQLSARRFYNWRTLFLRRLPVGRVASLNRAVREHLMEEWDHAETRPVDWVIGAAFYLRRKAVRDVGLMDERYFLYFEDVDFCERMWRHGYEVIYCADSVMIHEYTRASARLRPSSIRAHLAGLLRFTEKWSAVVYGLNQSRRRWIQGGALLLDLAAVAVACLAAYWFRAAIDPALTNPLAPFQTYAGLFYFAAAVTVAALGVNGLYRTVASVDAIERAFRIGQATLQSWILILAATFLFQMPRYSRFLVLVTLPLLFTLLYLGRTVIDLAALGARRQGFGFRRVLIVGSGADAERARASLEAARGEGYEPLHAEAPTDGRERPEEAAARLRKLLESERIQIACLVPRPEELSYLLAMASALRDSGAAIYWAGSLAPLVPIGPRRRLGSLDAVLLHAPSRGLSLKARKRASDLLLTIFVAPLRMGGLARFLDERGEGIGPGQAWLQVLRGARSWVGRSAYESETWRSAPAWARLALDSLRPGIVSPGNGAGSDNRARLEAELGYLARFSLAEDLRIFLRVTRPVKGRRA